VSEYLGQQGVSALSRVERHSHAVLGPSVFRHGLNVRCDRALTPSNFNALLRDSRRLQPEHRAELLMRHGKSLLRMHPFVMHCATTPLLREVKRLPEGCRAAPLGMVALTVLCREESAFPSPITELRELEAALMDLPVPLRVDALTVVMPDIPLERLNNSLVGIWLKSLVTSVSQVEHVWTLRNASRASFEPKAALGNVEQALRTAIGNLPADTPETLLVALSMPRRHLSADDAAKQYHCIINFAASHQGATATLAYIAAAELLPLLPSAACALVWHHILGHLSEGPPDLHCWLLESLVYGISNFLPAVQADYWKTLFGLTMMLPSSQERYIVFRQLCPALGAISVTLNVDLSITLVEACAEQEAPYRAHLLYLALVAAEPTERAWCAAGAHSEALPPDERPPVLHALAMTLDRAPDSLAAWQKILALALQLPVEEQGTVLLALTQALRLLPQAHVSPALALLLSHAKTLPREDRIAVLALLTRTLPDRGLSLSIFHAIRELPRLDRPLPLSSMAASIEQLHPGEALPAAWARILDATFELHPHDRLSPLIELDRTRKHLPLLTRWLADLKRKFKSSELPAVDAACLTAFRDEVAQQSKARFTSTRVRLQ